MTLDLEELETTLKGKLLALDEEQSQIEEQLRAVETVTLASGRLAPEETTSTRAAPATPGNTSPNLYGTSGERADAPDITQELVSTGH